MIVTIHVNIINGWILREIQYGIYKEAKRMIRSLQL